MGGHEGKDGYVDDCQSVTLVDEKDQISVGALKHELTAVGKGQTYQEQSSDYITGDAPRRWQGPMRHQVLEKFSANVSNL